MTSLQPWLEHVASVNSNAGHVAPMAPNIGGLKTTFPPCLAHCIQFTGRGHATDSREDLSLAMTLAQGVRGSHAHWYLPTAELIVYGEYWVNTIPIARGRKSYENITAVCLY